MTLVKGLILGVSIAGCIQIVHKITKNNKNEKKIIQTNKKNKRRLFGPFLSYILKQEKYSSKEQIIIRDKKELKKKLKNMKKDTLNEVQIVTDYDQTITPFNYNGKQSKSAFGMIRTSPVVPQSMKEAMELNFNKYYPYEQDHTLSREEKSKYMREWYDKIEEIFCVSNLTKDIIQQSFDSGNVAVRSGFKELFAQCYNVNLPYYVVSGGIDIIVTSVLNSICDINTYDNLFVYSNNMFINRKDKVMDLDMLIDTSSKHEILNLKNHKNFKKNTIVLGDSNNDIRMSGCMNSDNVVSVLFLNPKQEKDLESFFQEKWDIIIKSDEGESGYTAVIGILSHINSNQYNLDFSEYTDNFNNNSNYSELKELLQ